jgi:hypothetical protein
LITEQIRQHFEKHRRYQDAGDILDKFIAGMRQLSTNNFIPA